MVFLRLEPLFLLPHFVQNQVDFIQVFVWDLFAPPE